MSRRDARTPAEWPHQLKAAAALTLIGAVWLLVLPVAATTYVVLRGARMARRVPFSRNERLRRGAGRG